MRIAFLVDDNAIYGMHLLVALSAFLPLTKMQAFVFAVVTQTTGWHRQQEDRGFVSAGMSSVEGINIGKNGKTDTVNRSTGTS